jgi:hypothetical protein
MIKRILLVSTLVITSVTSSGQAASAYAEPEREGLQFTSSSPWRACPILQSRILYYTLKDSATGIRIIGPGSRGLSRHAPSKIIFEESAWPLVVKRIDKLGTCGLLFYFRAEPATDYLYSTYFFNRPLEACIAQADSAITTDLSAHCCITALQSIQRTLKERFDSSRFAALHTDHYVRMQGLGLCSALLSHLISVSFVQKAPTNIIDKLLYLAIKQLLDPA